MFSEIFRNVLNKIQKKEPDANQIILKFCIRNESFKGLAEKQVVNK